MGTDGDGASPSEAVAEDRAQVGGVPLLSDLTVLELDDQGRGPRTVALTAHLLAGLGARVRKVTTAPGEGVGLTGRIWHADPLPGETAALVDEGKSTVRVAPVDVASLRELFDRPDRPRLLLATRDHLPAEFEREVVEELDSQTEDGPLVYGTAEIGELGEGLLHANDFVAQAVGGLLATTGQPDGPPMRVGVPIGEHLAALYLGTGCLAAMTGVLRDVPGTRRHIRVSVVDSIVSSLTNFVAHHVGTGEVPSRIGNRHVAQSPWNVYPARDGNIIICIIADRMWRDLCSLMGRDDLGSSAAFEGQAKRRPQADYIDDVVSSWTSTRSVTDVTRALQEAGIPCGEVHTVHDVLRDRTLHERGFLRGDARAPSVGPLFRITSDAPILGATDEPDARRVSGSVTAPPRGGDIFFEPLKGLRVAEIASAAAGPMATRVLANLGAEVVKIEHPQGEVGRHVPPRIDGTSAVFQFNCNSKLSLCVDMKHPRQRDVVLGVMARVDAVVENLSPGRLGSWGLGFDDVRRVNPSIVYASVTGFGQAPPPGRLRAYDTVVQAAGGIMHLTGSGDGPPTKAGISLSDFTSGIAGAFAVSAAILGRQVRARRGAWAPVHLDLSMYEVTTWTTLSTWHECRAASGVVRTGNGSPTCFWQGLLSCVDGELALTIVSAADASRIADLLGLERSAGGTSEPTHLVAALQAWATGSSRREAAAKLQLVGVPAGPVRSVAEIVEDEGVWDRGVIAHASDDPGAVVMSAPIQVPGGMPRTATAAPRLGAHSRHVLTSLVGLSDREVDELVSTAVVFEQPGTHV